MFAWSDSRTPTYLYDRERDSFMKTIEEQPKVQGQAGMLQMTVPSTVLAEVADEATRAALPGKKQLRQHLVRPANVREPYGLD